MQQRYYDPIAARFNSNDPVGFTPSNPMMFNRYAYANNNPYKYVDPDGRNPRRAIMQTLKDSAGMRSTWRSIKGVLQRAGVVPPPVPMQNESVPDDLAGIPVGTDGDAVTSDREPGSDGKRGSTGGPGSGKRFRPESPSEKAGKEGVPCRYCGVPTTNTPGQPNSRERDHIDPKSRDGNNSSENEGDSCRSCNRSKGAKNPDEWQPPQDN